ncbi:hypothetical protein Vretifemale_10966, partial [Volvox reticuliferus]
RVIPVRGNGAPGGGQPPRGVPPLIPGAAGGGAAAAADCINSPRGGPESAGADRPCARRKTYNGDGGGGRAVLCGQAGGGGGAAGGRGIPPRRAQPSTLPGGVALVTAAGRSDGGEGCRALAAAWMGQGGQVTPPPLPLNGDYPQQHRSHRDGHDSDDNSSLNSSRIRSHRPSSAPPDSPIRRSRRGARESASSSGAGPGVSARAEGPVSLETTSSLGSLPLSALCSSSLRASISTVATVPSVTGSILPTASGRIYLTAVPSVQQHQQQHGDVVVAKGTDSQHVLLPTGRRPSDQGVSAAAAAVGKGGVGGRGEGGGGEGGGLDISDGAEMQENSEATFRYLPALRNLSCASSRGEPSMISSNGDEDGGDSLGDNVEDDAGADGLMGGDIGGHGRGSVDGGPAGHHTCAASPPPRRARSESVMRIKQAPMAAPAAAAGPNDMAAATATATLVGANTCAVASNSDTDIPFGSRRPATDNIIIVPGAGPGFAASVGASGSRPTTRDGQGITGVDVGVRSINLASTASRTAVISTDPGSRRASGTGHGATSGSNSNAAAGTGNRRTSGSNLGTGQRTAPLAKAVMGMGDGGRGRDSGAPAAVAAVPQRPRASAGQVGLDCRPSSAVTRPSSAKSKQEQQQPPPQQQLSQPRPAPRQRH